MCVIVPIQIDDKQVSRRLVKTALPSKQTTRYTVVFVQQHARNDNKQGKLLVYIPSPVVVVL
jgi:hypothetical protein